MYLVVLRKAIEVLAGYPDDVAVEHRLAEAIEEQARGHGLQDSASSLDDILPLTSARPLSMSSSRRFLAGDFS
jgi:hypothetical protein